MNREQIALRLRLALIEALPRIIEESAKPMERIDGIKILQVAGLGGGNGHGSGENGTAAGEGSLADQLVNSALRYRAQAPLLDLLMADLGLEAGDLNGRTRGLVKAAGGGESEGGGAANAETFEITITNLTNAQIFSPPRSEAHAPGTSLFFAGEGASEGIENMAESGDNAQLLVDLEDLEADMVESGGPVLPRATTTLTLTSEDGNRLISAVGMLVGTNDVFFGLGAVRPAASPTPTASSPMMRAPRTMTKTATIFRDRPVPMTATSMPTDPATPRHQAFFSTSTSSMCIAAFRTSVTPRSPAGISTGAIRWQRSPSRGCPTTVSLGQLSRRGFGARFGPPNSFGSRAGDDGHCGWRHCAICLTS